MKVYFATSTLNFSSIISSQRILPMQYYAEGALWWNRYEKTAAEKDGVTILYDRFPVWEINDPDRDNYPLVIEFKSCPVAKKARSDLNCEIDGKKLTAIFTNVPVEVSAKDILAGEIKFIFRNEEEKRRMLLKAESGVDECKILSALMAVCPGSFTVAEKNKNELRLPIKGDILLQIEATARKALENSYIADGLVREERLRGAQLGFELGGYVRSLRGGVFCGAFREKMEFGDWCDDVLPKSFNSILERFLDRPAMAWDPNRSAVLELVDATMAVFAKDKSVDKSVKNALLMLHNHWGSAEQRFKISEIEDPYLQAFAAFLECGTMPGKYPRYLKSMKLKNPEFMLALYGAVVGYTSFSRTLMINENYLPQPTVVENGVTTVSSSGSIPASKHRGEGGVNGGMTPPQVAMVSKTALSFVQKVAKEKKSKAKSVEPIKVQQRLQQEDLFMHPTMFCDGGSHQPLFIEDPMMVPVLLNFIKDKLSFNAERLSLVQRDAEYLQREYASGGRYALDPQNNPRDNLMTINHLMNLLSKKKTINEVERGALNRFLTERYK